MPIQKIMGVTDKNDLADSISDTTFRHSRWISVLSLAGLLLLPLAVAGIAWLPSDSDDDTRLRVLLWVFSPVWIALLALWMYGLISALVIGCRRYRIDDQGMVRIGCLGRRRIEWDDIHGFSVPASHQFAVAPDSFELHLDSGKTWKFTKNLRPWPAFKNAVQKACPAMADADLTRVCRAPETPSLPHRSQRQKKPIISSILIILWAVYFALLLTAATALVGRKYVNYWRLTTSNQVEHVIGEVVSKHSSKDSLSLKVRFVTHDGRERHIRRTVLHPFGKKQEEGSQVKVTYFSDNPRIARLADGDLDSRSWILFSLMSSGVTLAWAGLLHWVSAAFIPPREHFRFRISPGDEDDFFMLGSGLYFESILSAFPERHDGPILIQSLRSKDQSLPSHDLKVLHERMTKNGIEAQHIADTYLLLKTSAAERLTQRLDIIQGLTLSLIHI